MKYRNSGAALVVAVALLSTACSVLHQSEGPDRHQTPTSVTLASDGKKLEWGTCETRLARMANLECARLSVPLDPKDEAGDKINLAIVRRRANGTSADRIGSLVLNPGGPGGSGIEFLAKASEAFPEALRSRFDLVSFDPRGVGESTPVRCLSDEQKAEQLSGDLSPDTEEGVREAIRDQKDLLAACQKSSSKLLTHMSTADVAADLDRIRAALGEDKLTYAGFSYGTSIGAVYATMFPDKTRALVLDGAVDPTGSPTKDTLDQAMGFEATLARFESACDASKECSLTPDAKTAIDSTRDSLRQSPLKVDSNGSKRTLGVDQFDYALASGLYDTSMWGPMADAISNIRSGGAAMLLSLMDLQTGRKPDGSFDNSTDAHVMVSCADSPEPTDKDQAIAAARAVEAAAPNFGPIIGWDSLSCLNWPKPANPLPKITGAGAPPVLVVGTKGDPATPYAWAESMASALESATLLTYEGSGHTAFMKGGPCIDDAVVSYLVDLKVPSAGTSCPEVADAVSFAGISQQVIEAMTSQGLPKEVAKCIVDAAIKEKGEAAFDQLVLDQDAEALKQLIMAKTLACAKLK